VQRKFGLTQEKEELFQKYKSSVSFTISPSLSFLLFDNKHQNVYDTHEVAIYDGKDLIGIGIYDKGKKYAAGITCLYDPLYKKYSIGKFLMLYKMLLLKESGLEYFYPGYFTPNQKVFEYKLHLSPQQTEYFDFINKVWLPLSDYDKSNTMLLEKENKLSLLSTKLYRIDIPHKVCKYPYFDAALNPTFQANYELQEPTFILLKDYQNENDFVLIIIYDVQQKKYKLIECYVLGFPSYPIAGENYYNEAVLQVCDVLETFTEIGTKMRLSLKKILK
jgi:arginine-tRNA-protein transferase